MSLTRYREVLRLPGVARLLLFATVARVPQIAAGVVLTLHVVVTLHRGYAEAGLVGTASTLGMAVGGPLRGRAIDRSGLRRALIPSVVSAAVVWGSAPFLPFPLLVLDAVVGGLFSTPIFAVVRQSLAVLVPDRRHRTGYALDSMGTEISFIVGPAAGVLIATEASTTSALLAIALTSVLAALALIAFNPPTRSPAAGPGAPIPTVHSPGVNGPGVDGPDRLHGTVPPSGRPALRTWFSPALAAVLAATAAVTVVLTGTDVAIIAHLRAVGALSLTGVVFAAWGGGSILGGLVYGTLHRSVHPLVLLLGLGLLTVPVGLIGPGAWGLVAAILPAAALCAPALTATAERVSRLVPEQVRGEAMGWHGSALTVGVAVGSPLAGAVIDAHGPGAGFVTVGAVGALLAVLGLLAGVVARHRPAGPAVRPRVMVQERVG